MTYRPDVANGRDIVARWCSLAEQRLEYLTELFETGRWRRFHGERDFLENIRDAKAAVETWRDLLSREASSDNRAIDMSWLGRSRAALPRGETWRDQTRHEGTRHEGTWPDQVRLSQAVEISTEQALENSILLLAEVLGEKDTPSAPAMDDRAPGLTPDLPAITERYPLLHNAL